MVSVTAGMGNLTMSLGQLLSWNLKTTWRLDHTAFPYRFWRWTSLVKHIPIICPSPECWDPHLGP